MSQTANQSPDESLVHQRSLFDVADQQEIESLESLTGWRIQPNTESGVDALWMVTTWIETWGFGDTPEEAVDAALDYFYDDLPDGVPVPTAARIRADPAWYDSLWRHYV